MIQILKYIVVFFLGCLFMAHNPSLNSKVISLSTMLRDKVVELTGKAERMDEKAKQIEEYKRKKLEEEEKNKAT